MTAHVRGKTFESVGVFSGQTFYRPTCQCGWAGHDVSDEGIAREDWKRHAARQAELAAA